jgi:hypothetical protein
VASSQMLHSVLKHMHLDMAPSTLPSLRNSGVSFYAKILSPRRVHTDSRPTSPFVLSMHMALT